MFDSDGVVVGVLSQQNPKSQVESAEPPKPIDTGPTKHQQQQQQQPQSQPLPQPQPQQQQQQQKFNMQQEIADKQLKIFAKQETLLDLQIQYYKAKIDFLEKNQNK